jgi:predicted CXXCH cytochrome family protein
MELHGKTIRLIICCVFVFAFSCLWLVDGRADTEKASLTCVDCHADIQSKKYLHFPDQQGNCQACHEPTPEHLKEGGPGKIKTNKGVDSCLACHDSINKGKYVHPILDMNKGCTQCHNPHGSDNEYLLVKPLNIICLECHDPLPADVEEGSEHTIVKEGKACINCHQPHSSDLKLLLKEDMVDLCLSCHDRKITFRKNGRLKEITNIKQKVKEMAHVHPPAKWCTSCHASHGSKYRSLLVAAFPDDNYNRYVSGDNGGTNTYDLCFGCHKKKMLNENIGPGDTKFRNDTVKDGVVVRENLHWFHVVNAAGSDDINRGRNCKICHDPHGSPNPHLIRPTWTIKNFNATIVYEASPDGGACLKSCHSPKTYQRIK